jgi:hypothetical protein
MDDDLPRKYAELDAQYSQLGRALVNLVFDGVRSRCLDDATVAEIKDLLDTTVEVSRQLAPVDDAMRERGQKILADHRARVEAAQQARARQVADAKAFDRARDRRERQDFYRREGL